MPYQDKPPLDELIHYGMPRRSGRYPYGSGDNPYQHSGDFLGRVKELKNKGLSEKEIADSMGLSTTQFRIQKSLAKDEERSYNVDRAKSLREDGLSLNEIAEKMGFKNDSSVRSLLNEDSEARMNQAQKTAEFLKKQVDEKGMIDVGAGVERELHISKEKLKQALYILELEGYPEYGGGVEQVTNRGKQTNLKVLCPPGTEHKDIYKAFNENKINSITEYTSHDGGDTFDKFVYPKSLDSKRLKIVYADEGGLLKDGLVEIRRGVDDLSLGNSKYAQVRILVDDTKYIKGMAVYSDNIPEGVDMVFYCNKTRAQKDLALKDIKKDSDNPFGSLIKAGGQSYYTDKDGNRQLSLINKRAEEGDWGEWADHLSSQFLSKQSMSLIKKQLSLAANDKIMEYESICELENPTVKKMLLNSFATDCDAAAVHLKAAALPRQKYQVILPMNNLKDNEVYAPYYKDGEKVALVRYPHGGTFEIPILTVNNKNKEGKNLIGNALDAVGINVKVAERLSGADFDGDTVMVIPTNDKIKITSTPPLKGLEGFDPRLEYRYDEVKVDANGEKHYHRGGREFKRMANTQNEMGKVSNLITDMTLKGATEDELARAVRHSMVVIDAEKHILDYKKSEKDNAIDGLKKKYQAHTDDDGYGGASTLISKAGSEMSVRKRRGQPWVNAETGALEWERINPKTGEFESKYDNKGYTVTKVNKKTGEVTETVKYRMDRSTKMAETNDARTLSSGRPQEEAYADYANRMKALANQARKEALSTGKIEYSAAAKEKYSEQVKSLDAKLSVALMNAPRERKAQVIANSKVKAKIQENPDMTKSEIKKASQQALTEARLQVGAKRTPITITDKEWEAIQSGAISESKLIQIINHTDTDNLRERATPRTRTTLTPAKKNKIKSMLASGYTTSEIAEGVGVSPATIANYIKGKE